ncbi:uncharacterized protein LOC135482250 isoform X2 [Liolophura sinensis]|uniref:uncharacterized protein LOC135482250 isoform X2 n=1 Tax=Liolophura sinensis TaxID=3198878 RepID=UPI0031594AA4
MVMCVIKHCTHTSGKDSGKSFYRLPSVITRQGERTEYLSRKRRNAWLGNIGRPELKERTYVYIRVCSDHFVSGKPSPLYSTESPDWAPTLNLGHDVVEKPLSKRAAARHERYKEQKRKKLESEAAVSTDQSPDMGFSNVMPVPLPVNATEPGACIPVDLTRVKVEPPDPVPVGLYTSALNDRSTMYLEPASSSIHEGQQQLSETNNCKPSELLARLMGPPQTALQRDHWQNQPVSKDVLCQSDIPGKDFLRMEAKLKFMEAAQKRLCRELSCLHRKVLEVDFTEESLANNEIKVNFYTGFDNFRVLKRVFHDVSDEVKTCQKVVDKFQEFLITLIILRINVSFGDIALRFNISECTVSEIYQNWMGNLAVRLRNAVHWPARITMRANIPEKARLYFVNSDKIAVIIDCLEVFIDDPLLSSGETSLDISVDNKNSSSRFLLAMDPSGRIMCVSGGLRGDITNNHLIQHCSLSENLLPGDWVLADERNPDIDGSESQFNCCVYVARKLPTFEAHLSTLDLNSNRLVLDFCQHVRHISGQLQNKYQILQGTLPSVSGVSIDQVVFVCAALSNLSYNFDQSG